MKPMLFKATAFAVTATLLLSSCATKTAHRESQENSTALEAAFVDKPAAEKKSPFAGLGSFFSKLLPSKTPRPPAASPVQWAGEIRMVNIAENFVLVESISAVATIPGEKYLVVQNGRETGVVRMTSLRNPPFLIADIVSGDPSPGDKIHLPRPIVSPQSVESHTSKKPGFFQKWLREILPTSKPKE
jgi:hypothetical protein